MLSDLVNATWDGVLFWVGFVVLVTGIFVLAGARKAASRTGWGLAGGGAALAVAMFIVAGATTTVTGSVTTVPGTTVNTVLASSPALVSGETWNQASSTLSVYLLYNTTGSYFCVAATAASTHGCAAGGAGSATHPLDIVFPLNLIRTDNYNTTALFNLGVTSIPTALSLGSSAALYSLIGFKSATSTTPGQWQLYNSYGTQASQYPTVSAPSVSTNVITNGIAVKGFSSQTDTLHFHLAGTNSTSAPETFAAALTNYTAYPISLAVSQSTPAVITINLIEIGWTT